MPRTRQLPDLVRDNKLEARIRGNSTRHVLHRSGRSARDRHVRTEELWVREAVLGQGAHSTVYRERCDDGEIYKLRAVKEMKKRVIADQDLDYMRELEAIFKFSHPRYSHCFVRSNGWFEDQDSVFISMEYLEFGDLQKNLDQPLPEVEVKEIVDQVLEGLGYMHDNGFVHRDLKPGNIMVVVRGPDWVVKIADFGISKRRYEDVSTLMTMYRGTFGFAAPEMIGFQPDSDSAKVSRVNFFAVDMWSLGALAFKLLTNATAFFNFIELSKYIEGRMDFPQSKLELHNVSEGGRDFVARLMSIAPEARLTVTQAKDHPWVSVLLAPIITTIEPSSPETGMDEKVVDLETGVSIASAMWSSDVTASTTSKKSIDHPAFIDEDDGTDFDTGSEIFSPTIPDNAGPNRTNRESKLPLSNHTPTIEEEDSTEFETDSDTESYFGLEEGGLTRRNKTFARKPKVTRSPGMRFADEYDEAPRGAYDETFNRGNRGVPQNNKRFVDAYDQDEFRGHEGSSGAAKRVMELFRRRAKASTNEG